MSHRAYAVTTGLIFLLIAPLLGGTGLAQQVTGQDLDKIQERADKLLEEAKSAYEDARSKSWTLVLKRNSLLKRLGNARRL